MNQLQSFNFKGNDVRTVLIDESPWWVAVDVCKVLEHTNVTVALQRLDSDEVTKFNLGGLSGDTNLVNEYGLYSLILGSRKAESKEFKRWATHEVLPTIRNHGVYLTPEKMEEALLNPDMIIRLATQLKNEREEKQRLEMKVALDQPLVVFAESLQVSHDSILIGGLAKLLKQNGLNLGQNRLFEMLRKQGYLMSGGDQYNMPTQRSMEMQLFEIQTRSITNPDGAIRVTKTTRVTGKGQIYFVNKFKNDSMVS